MYPFDRFIRATREYLVEIQIEKSFPMDCSDGFLSGKQTLFFHPPAPLGILGHGNLLVDHLAMNVMPMYSKPDRSGERPRMVRRAVRAWKAQTNLRSWNLRLRWRSRWWLGWGDSWTGTRCSYLRSQRPLTEGSPRTGIRWGLNTRRWLLVTGVPRQTPEIIYFSFFIGHETFKEPRGVNRRPRGASSTLFPDTIRPAKAFSTTPVCRRPKARKQGPGPKTSRQTNSEASGS